VYYIDSSYCGTKKLHRWVEYGYIWKYEINYITCCKFNVVVRLELEERSFLLEELYSTKEEAKQALDNIEKIGE
ncbi:MAG: hypothetical protein KBS91_02435, partial [Firmicutes bacterium]|nr:hypothetical protein [Candidatus Caballimonas caccae]